MESGEWIEVKTTQERYLESKYLALPIAMYLETLHFWFTSHKSNHSMMPFRLCSLVQPGGSQSVCELSITV